MKIPYLNANYKNSAAYNSVMGCSSAQLATRKPYTILALEYHKAQGNLEQAAFFESELALIEKRLTMLRIEYLRGEIESERISYGEIAELETLIEYIDPSDPIYQWVCWDDKGR